MGSDKCGNRLQTILKIVDLLLGIALTALGAYRYAEDDISEPHIFFLSFYYIFFGIVLITFVLPFQRLHSWFHCLIYPFGKAMFLLFLAALTFDIFNIIYMIFTIVAVGCSIAHIVFMLCYYVPEVDNQHKKPKKSNRNQSDDGSPAKFGPVIIDENKNESFNDTPGSALPRRQ
ncbi:hypothetical protein SteCoe_8817 [Stentor coeruleus]|uniref:MARVEL domain-containing protein n=1 Tax=Stentor coeruleus TaxID=5963 RepID=A0A1R2CJG5_9CILI|nr:hypothetical protein SteCoe_8817 [Stentor coeruleus]